MILFVFYSGFPNNAKINEALLLGCREPDTFVFLICKKGTFELKMFGSTGFGNTGFMGPNVTAPSTHNPMKDFEVVSPPDDAISCLAFSPATIPQTNFLIAGSWDNYVRCWEIDRTGKSMPKSQQSMTAPVLDVAWIDVSCSNGQFSIIDEMWQNLYNFHFRMAAKCLWLDVIKWPNAGTCRQTRVCRCVVLINYLLQIKWTALMKLIVC